MKSSLHKKAKATRQQLSFFAKKKERSFFAGAASHAGFMNKTSEQDVETADDDFAGPVEDEEMMMGDVVEPSVIEDDELAREPLVPKEEQEKRDTEKRTAEMKMQPEPEPAREEAPASTEETPGPEPEPEPEPEPVETPAMEPEPVAPPPSPAPPIAKTQEPAEQETESVKEKAPEPPAPVIAKNKTETPAPEEPPAPAEKEEVKKQEAEKKEEEQKAEQKPADKEPAAAETPVVEEAPAEEPAGEAAPAAEGGGAAEPAAAAMEAAPLDGTDTDSILKSWTGSSPIAFLQNDASVNSLASSAQQAEKQDLKESYPEIEKPTGIPAKDAPAETGEVNLQKEAAPDLDPEGGKVPLLKPELVSISNKPVNNIPLPKDLGKPATEEEEGSWFERMLNKARNFIGKIKTEDNSVETSAGPRPNVPLEGEADPEQNKAHQEEATESVDADKQKSDEASQQYFGENDIYPESNPEMLTPATQPAEPLALGESPAGEMPVFDEKTAEGFNIEARAKMDEQINAEMAKYETEREKKDADSELERENTDKQIAEETENTRAEQEGLQNQAKADVENQRSEWRNENEKVKQTYADQSEQKRAEIDGQIDEKVAETEKEVSEKYDAAEEEAAAKKREAEEEAERKKREEENKPRSWWQKIGDAISSVLDAIRDVVNAIFDAVRAVVKGIIDAVKSAVMALIDLARSAIVGLIKAFGEALKAFVNIALAAFPELAKKFNDYIDKAVNYAVEKVNELADALKAAVSALLDALASVLDAILGAFQAFYNAILDVLHFLTVGLMKILEGIANLVSAASDMPDHFWGQVSEELLGFDVTQPLPNERPPKDKPAQAAEQLVESGAITEQDKNVAQKQSLDPQDVAVDEVASDFQVDPEVMDEINEMPEDGETIIETGEGGPEQVDKLKNEALTGEPAPQETTAQEATAQEEPVSTPAETPAPAPAAQQEGAAATQDGLVGPFTTGERLAYVAGQMKEGIKKWWGENKVMIIAALVLGIAGLLLANLLTGGAILALVPLVLQLLAAYFAAQALYNATKYFGTFLSEGYSGHIGSGAKALARAFAIIVIELVFSLIAVFKGVKTAVKTVAKQGVKGALKTGGKALRTAVTTSIKNTAKTGVKTLQVAWTGAKTAFKNGKMILKGIKSGFGKGAKSLGALAKKLANKLRLKRIKIVRRGWRFSIWGEFNPWVLMATGEVKHVEYKGPRKKTPRVGDTFAGGTVVGAGGKTAPSKFVKRLMDNPEFNKSLTDLLAAAGNIDKKSLIKGLTNVPPKHVEEVLEAIIKFKDLPGIEKVVQDLAKRGGNFTLGAAFVLVYLKRNPHLAKDIVDFEKAVTILQNLRREVDVVLQGKEGWLEFKNWLNFRPSTFADQMVKDLLSGKNFRWIFSRGMGSKAEVLEMVKNLLHNKEFLKSLPKAQRDVLKANIPKILKSIRVARFHVKF